MITINKKSECCGCGGCVSVCPVKAITLRKDDEGFLFPVVDREKCTNCGLCDRVCDFRCKSNVRPEHQKFYAAYNNNKDVVEKSSSGGIFTLLSDAVLEVGGAVYGAYFDKEYVVRTGRARTALERDKFLGSKYVQSNAWESYELLCEDLRNGLVVLFCGTPCQVAVVKKIVKEKRIDDTNLYLVDFICHGVASPRVWKDYVKHLKERWGGLGSYTFRGKKEGWHGWYPIIKTPFGDVSLKHKEKDSFVLMYQTMYFNRRSCFKCPYTSYNRVADITLADFWNVDSFAKDMDNDTGVSEVIVNTNKGHVLFGVKMNEMTVRECTKEQAWQPHLEYPNPLPKGRRKFWELYVDEGFDEVLEKYGKGDAMTKLKNKATPVLKKTGLYTVAGKAYKAVFVKKNGK